MENLDVIIMGAGAAGLMCALTAGAKGKKVLVLEHTEKPGAKILISGGGRCNFTNLEVAAHNYISKNPHFAKSALSRYSPYDFMDLLAQGGATWHEKTLGQLFCNEGARKVLNILLEACAKVGVVLKVGVEVADVASVSAGYRVETSCGTFTATNLVIATGGMSIPKMGATDFGYRIARQFGLDIIEPVPALVPFVFDEATVAATKELAGVSTLCTASCGTASFRENLLFTHRGLSGPAILQISSYWQHGDTVVINLLPSIADVFSWLKDKKKARPRASVKSILVDVLPERLAVYMVGHDSGNMADYSHEKLHALAARLSAWTVKPTGTEGFKKAEVTRGGVSTDCLSSRTMEAKTQPGLYFIGECVDVTGWLGGYNFQWAWASGAAAADAL
ncbi:BaiN/RdsA family NAD(P)/FAD-dependent oxidoreductase [Kordiimonas pumila]|uniref:NAD(P)/FAD-dependent oxidoreductase n=1 Tax=Kordiimonas pumila TaxID=2161677 RepID=A0ABV7D5D2_9PROT|nr:NAD(P)/FAD-dependent oxidoreductase [Kordiimonas pumila]